MQIGVDPSQQFRTGGIHQVVEAFRHSPIGLVLCPLNPGGSFSARLSSAIRDGGLSEACFESNAKTAPGEIAAILEDRGQLTRPLSLELALSIVQWNGLLLEMYPSSTINTFIVTNAGQEIAWHTHPRTPYLTVTLDAPVGERRPATLFAPYVKKRDQVEERGIVSSRVWELAMFWGDILHTSPPVSGPRTLLRSMVL